MSRQVKFTISITPTTAVILAFVAGAMATTFISPLSIANRLLGDKAYAQEGQQATQAFPTGAGETFYTDESRRDPGEFSRRGFPQTGTKSPLLGNAERQGSPIRQNPNIDRELMNNGFTNPVFVALQDLVAVYGAINFSNDLPNPYRRVEPWGTPPPGNNGEWASSIGAQGGPDGFLYVLHRCSSQGRCSDSKIPPIVKLNPVTGASVATMGAGLMSDPHGFHVDGQNNVWATDTGNHTVRKFSPDGKLLMTIGTPGKSGAPHLAGGTPASLIYSPTDVVTAPNGDIFVTENHNKLGPSSRVSKFAPDGRFIKYLSKGAGSGPQQVSGPHAIAIDRQGRLFVGDRDNNRILIWDQEGNFIDMWHQFSRPSGIWIDYDDTIYVADSESWGSDNLGWRKGLRIGSAVTGQVQYFIEDIESRDFDHSGAEGIGVDAFGNIYGTTNRRQSIERHEPPKPKPSRAATWGPATGAWPPTN